MKQYILYFAFLILSVQKANSQSVMTPKRVALFAAVLPGSGQVINKRYWKLPIVYGGLGASAGFFLVNHSEYKRFKTAYIDLENGKPIDPNIALYSKNQIYELQNSYRSTRDLFGLLFVGVYALQIVDAYVDRHLMGFKISEDFEAQILPTYQNSFHQPSVGLSLTVHIK